MGNPPSSFYPHQPQAAPQDVPPINVIQAPTRHSKRMAVSYAATDITRQDCGLRGQTDVAEPGSGSSSDQQGSLSMHADEPSRQTSVERSVSLSTEALPAVMLPANQPASFSIVICDDSSQLIRKREHSSNLIHLSGKKQAPPDTSKYPVKRQATSYVMHSGSTNQGHDCLHSEPAALSHEHIQHHNHFQQQQQTPDMVQAGSCNFDSLTMYAPTGLADAQAQRYSTQAPDAQQPPQQAAWTSVHLQPDQSSILDVLPMGMLQGGSSGNGSSSPKQRAGWGWSVTTGHEKHAARYGSDQDTQFSRLPMSGVLPHALSRSDISWEQQAWQDVWQQHQHQEQHHQHHHQQQAYGSDQWAMFNQCFDQWQPCGVDAAAAIKQNEPDGALAGFDESEGSQWMMPHYNAKHR